MPEHDFAGTVRQFLGTLARVYSGRDMPADELDAFVTLFLEQAGPPKQEVMAADNAVEEEPCNQEYEDKMRSLLDNLNRKAPQPLIKL